MGWRKKFSKAVKKGIEQVVDKSKKNPMRPLAAIVCGIIGGIALAPTGPLGIISGVLMGIPIGWNYDKVPKPKKPPGDEEKKEGEDKPERSSLQEREPKEHEEKSDVPLEETPLEEESKEEAPAEEPVKGPSEEDKPDQMPPGDEEIAEEKPILEPVTVEEKPPRYLGNANTKEIHDLDNRRPGCKIDKIKENHKEFFDSIEEVEMAIKDQRYDGCRWCLNEYNTG